MHEHHDSVERGDTDHRLVRRIESFSDLVIGFSLALLALTLAIPDHAYRLFSEPSWLFIYFWTFAVVALLWLNHQRLFAVYFTPTKLATFLNFALLALVGLVVFFVQVFGKQHDSADKALAFLAYWITLGTEFGILGVLFGLGTRARWTMLPAQQREEGVHHTIRGLLLAAGTYGGIALDLKLGHFTMRDSYLIALPIVAGALIARFVRARMRGRSATGAATP